jgi:hypothetical protein
VVQELRVLLGEQVLPVLKARLEISVNKALLVNKDQAEFWDLLDPKELKVSLEVKVLQAKQDQMGKRVRQDQLDQLDK